MKLVFCSNSGESLPIAYRLRREGTDASVYLHCPAYRNNYDGLVPKLNLVQLKAAVKKADLVIFDITRPNEKTKQDVALLKTFGLKSSSPTVFGPVADKLRKSVKVIGCSTVCEDIELGRAKGVELAERMGFAIPETHQFKTLADGIKFLKSSKELWVFKPEDNQDLDLTYVEKFPGELVTKLESEYRQRLGEKIDFILQKKIDGVELSSEVWLGPKGPAHLNHTLENKRLMDGNLGPAIGSQSNTVWIDQDLDGICGPQLVKMAEYLRKDGYIGPCDANCIISEKDQKPYFLEWSPRFGYDAIYCLLSLVKGRLTDFFAKDFNTEFHSGFASSERISIPPFPYADSTLLKEYAKDVSILNRMESLQSFWGQDIYLKGGKLACAGADGILGVVAARGNSLGGAWGSVYRAIEQLKVCSYLQHRLDGHRSLSKRYETLQKWGLVNG
jgi:phosphoribosylamine-glycine ligase